MTPAISVAGLSRRYRGQIALDDVTLDVEGGSITGLLGRNGAGKTTFMRIVAGHEFASAGSVTVLGASPVKSDQVLRRMVFIREDQFYPDFNSGRRCGWLPGSTRTGTPSWPRAARRFRPADRPKDQEAVPRDALSAGHCDRPGRPGRGDTVRRALCGPGRRGPPGLLRSATRRLRRAPPHGAAVHPPDRRGRRPAGTGGGDRPRPHRAGSGRRRSARQRDQRERPRHRGGGVHRRADGLEPAADRIAGVGGGGRCAGRHRPRPGPGAAPEPGTADAATGRGPRRRQARNGRARKDERCHGPSWRSASW